MRGRLAHVIASDLNEEATRFVLLVLARLNDYEVGGAIKEADSRLQELIYEKLSEAILVYLLEKRLVQEVEQ